MDYTIQYDKIYQFCFYHVKHQQTAEDLTQETFLRFLEHPEYQDKGKDLQFLYTIARNLCTDEFRKVPTESLEDEYAPTIPLYDETVLTHITLQHALQQLSEEDRELVLLRYVNEEPVSVISDYYGISRFALNRKLKRILGVLRAAFEKEGSD